MQIHYSQACDRCIRRHIGPALAETFESIGVKYCGGCGQTVEQFRFSYWFPYEDHEDQS